MGHVYPDRCLSKLLGDVPPSGGARLGHGRHKTAPGCSVGGPAHLPTCGLDVNAARPAGPKSAGLAEAPALRRLPLLRIGIGLALVAGRALGPAAATGAFSPPQPPPQVGRRAAAHGRVSEGAGLAAPPPEASLLVAGLEASRGYIQVNP